MTLRLTIDEQAWRSHVDIMRGTTSGLVPVVKGNGYGFGRATLAREAAAFAGEIAVGTVHELADVAEAVAIVPNVAIVALTPAMHLPPELPRGSVPTVGSPAHLDVLRRHGWTGPIAVKLESSMHRHGVSPDGLDDLSSAVRSAGLDLHQFVLHLALPSPAFTPQRAVAEIERWLGHLDRTVPVSVSHLSTKLYDDLCTDHPERSFRLRTGTALWHGDKSFLHLAADVLEVRTISVGEPIGYRQVPAAGSGRVVMVGAGSAHGVVPLDGGLSPFHHARQRLTLVESPHMHTSMVFMPDGAPSPAVGDWVDVQQPLINVTVDEMVWR